MSEKSFVHLHSHGPGSTLDGLTKVKEMIEVAKELSQPGIALTDHGNLSGAYDLYKASKDSGVKPIFGIEAYLAPQVSRLHKEPVRWNPGGDDDVSGNGSYTHMTLLAKTDEGLHNLMKMSSEAFLSGYYYKPRMDDELLSQYGKGVIGTSGCVSGEIQLLIRLGRYEDAKVSAMKFQDIFGKGNFFIELMDHGLDIERRGLKDLIRLAKELKIPMVATNDLHYARKSDADTHEALLAIGTGSTLDDPTRFKFDSKEFYIKSAREMRAIWDSEVPEACDNTLLICESIEATFHEGKDLMPKFDVPEGESEDSWLRKEVYTGLNKKFPEGIPLEYKERAEHELGVISQLGFASYFLVTADFIGWSRKNGIRVGPGRGCLSGDTMVATPLGFRNIKELKIGDEVFDEIGNFVAITNTMTYQCDEPLINIKTFYGTREGESMTSDHKVLVSKANKETDKKLLRHGHKFKKEPASPQWIRADQVELGDLLVRPKLQVKIDANPFIVKNPEYFRPSNTEGIRTIARLAGVSRSVVNKYKDGTSITIDRPATLRLKDWVSQNTSELMAPGFGYRTTIVNKVLPKTYDLGKLLGFWISDGWICSDRGKNLVGFCCRRSEDDNEIPNLISKVLGITDIGIANHPLKDLRQFNISHKGLRDWILEIFPDYESTSGTKYIPEALLNTPEEFRRGLLEGLWAGDGSHSGKSKYATVSKRLAYNVQYLLLTLGLPASLNTSIRKEKRADRRNYTWIEYSIVSVHNFGKIKVQNGSDYDGKFIYSRVREINLKEPEGFVYDITVPTTQSYVTNNFVVHNSSAGSIIAYALSIVQVDPIRFGLLFERFLNIARATGEDASPPDIDIDFQPEGRERVIEYITQKYGPEKVAAISTSMQLKGRSSIKDSARVLSATYGLGDKINKLYPKPIVGRDLSLVDLYDPENERYDDGTELRTLVASDSEALKVVELAKALEGTKRGFGMHAAGIILSREPITDTVPVMKRDATSAVMTQFEYPVAEKLGLIKFDFLGLSNLSTISECLRLIKKNKEIIVDLEKIGESLNDTKTFRLLARGDTTGVFQLDSGPMRSLLRLMAPDQFDDIAAVLALYRPGPMAAGSPELYSDRKNGRKKIVPIHPELGESLKDILGETFQIILYQEEIMQIAQKVAGYSLVQADLLRRAMGKKKKEILDKEFEGFSAGMRNNGYSQDCIDTLWAIMVPFADYAFNKSHSVAYAMVSYWTAYLKANFPVEYMAALLSTNADDKDKSAIYLAECRRMGIRVLNPDVNLSESLYSAVGEDIRVGLSAIKGVGEKSVEAWIVSRDERGFAKSFSDFLENGDSAICKKNVVAALIKSGAFDSFGKTRASLDAVHVEAVERAAAMKKSKGKMKKGQEQDSLFGPDDSDMFSVMIPEIAEWDQQLLLSYEKDMLGLYVSGHPLADLTDAILNWQEVSIADLKEGARSGSTVKIAGLVTSFERKVTKKGDPWALITLEDLDANIVVYCFPRTYNAAADILKSDAIVIISGKSEPRDDGSVAFMASSITAPNLSKVTRSDPQLWMDRQVVVQDELSDGTPVVKPKGDPEDNRQINIKVLESDLTPENVERLKVALVDHPGYRPVTVLISDEDGNSLGTMELEYKVYGSADLGAKIRYLFGSSAV